MDVVSAIVGVIGAHWEHALHLGLAVAAWRLANQLKIRVENHETRIVKLETLEAA